MIEAIAASLGLPFGLLSALVSVESGGLNLINFNDSGTPSYGLVQMKMNTAKGVDPKFVASDLMKPEKNLRLGGTYLLQLYDKYGNWEQALCAYNTGRGRKSCGYSKKIKKLWAMEKIK